jgi:HPr kinase/phosphorylase
MLHHDTVTVEGFYTQHHGKLGLRLIAGANGLKRVIREPTVNRPGLALAGFTKYFAFKRVQVIGNAEVCFLRSLAAAARRERYAALFSYRVPCVVFCRKYSPDQAFVRIAEQADVPVFRSPLVTMKFINQATLLLEAMFSPYDNELGSMVDILGIGVIIRGESGIGKSECVLALLERGYCLVSDDVTRVRLIEGKEVVGSSPELTRNHMEVRGIGIINVAAMFGIRSIRPEKRVDLVVTLKAWNEVPDVDRLGIQEEFTKVLGIDLPHIIIPVKPGRDIARLIEVAALQTKLRKSGHNPAKELDERLIAQMTGQPAVS